ncbi:MAG: FAD-dependent protein [Eubacteriales bacterium]
MIKLNDIKVSVDYTDDEIKKAIAIKLKISANDIKSFDVVRRSIDARYKNVRFSLGISADIEGKDEHTNEDTQLNFQSIKINRNDFSRPVVVGAGPAGMFAALVLAECGIQPILIERGQSIEERKKQIDHFQNTGELNTESNVCFGEGGAGTFSDGKLVTRVNDPLCKYILNTFVEHGASKDILIDAKPHIGTDILSDILVKIRKRIISLGGEISFGEKLEDISCKNGKIESAKTSKREIKCESLILATGHGARDIYYLLKNRNIIIEPKGFAMGVRIEHKRSMIDKAIYGSYADHKRLGAAMYSLKGNFSGRSVYSFCMCPGGEVINASTERDGICVNGMSYNARDGENSNAAVVVQMNPKDWGEDALAGIEFQRKIERLCFQKAGGDFSVPIQKFGDFEKNTVSSGFGDINSSLKGKTNFINIPDILGEDISSSIKQAINYWERIIEGYSSSDALLSAVESRTSSPIRVTRGGDMQSVSIAGIYPCGEGAGYAGGIMSAAIDGIKCALEIINKIKKETDK